MNAGDNYGSFRYALAIIKGKLSTDALSAEEQKQQIDQAFNILIKIANKDKPSAEALTELGELFEYGFFLQDSKRCYQVEKNLKKAISYYTKAKGLMLPRASNNLGVLLMNDKKRGPGKSELQDPEIDTKILRYLS